MGVEITMFKKAGIGGLMEEDFVSRPNNSKAKKQNKTANELECLGADGVWDP